MVEKILKETYVNPKVELTQNDYNRLVSLATMKAKKIEERAREIYEKEGVVKIEFDGRFKTKRYVNRGETEYYEFEVNCKQRHVNPNSDYEETLFTIPQEMRERIAKKVKRYVEEVFCGWFGEHLYEINAIRELKTKTQKEFTKTLVWTITGWLLAVLMFGFVLLK